MWYHLPVRLIKRLIVLLGIISPPALIGWLISLHGVIETVGNYAPLLLEFRLVAGAGLLILFLAVIELYLRRRTGRLKRFPSNELTALSAIVVLAVLFFTAYMFTPWLVRHGDIQPQVILEEGTQASGAPKMAIAFWTEKPTISDLRWGRTEIKDKKAARKHWFELNGLEPDRSYDYSVDGEPIGSFRTPPAAGRPLRIAVGSDPHFGAFDSRSDRTIKMLNTIREPANKYAAFFLLGDLVQLGFNDNMWKQALMPVSTLTSTIPGSFVLGNHDSMFLGDRLYRNYLCPPGQRPFWRRIDIGRVHFLELDLEYGLLLYTPEQEQWLKQQLAAIPRADWCVVMCHTFFYCSGGRQDGWDWFDNKQPIAKLVPLFEQYGVDLVLSGHKHQSEVLKQNSITYGIFGSFGGRLDEERTYTSPASIWYQAEKHCFAEIDFYNDKTGRLVVRDDDNKVMFETGLVNR